MYTLSDDELQFWNDFIPKYLTPLDLTDAAKQETMGKLTRFRNQIIIGYVFLTALIVTAQYQIGLVSQKLDFQIKIPVGNAFVEVDYLSLYLLIIYAIQIIFQVIGLLSHRIGTLAEYLSITELRTPGRKAFGYERLLEERHHRSLEKRDRGTLADDQLSAPDPSMINSEDFLSNADAETLGSIFPETRPDEDGIACTLRRNRTKTV